MINAELLKHLLNWIIVYLMVILGYLMMNLVLTSLSPKIEVEN